VTITQTSLNIERLSFDGKVLGTVALDPTIFGVMVNIPLLHQVVNAQLAARRSGTQKTKTRAEVAGGAAKPFRQKGTGNARQGTNRAPHFSGGGVALGPRPRSYDQKTPRKMIQAALRCALSDRASEGGIRLVENFGLSVPKTKGALAVLEAIKADGRVLVVLHRDDDIAARSLSNLPHVVTLPGDQLTAFDVLSADVVVFTDETLPGERVEVAAAPVAATKRAPRTAPAKPKAADVEAPVDTVEEQHVAGDADAAVEESVTSEETASDTAEEGDAK
jgi:large subunit ribosomal protein L4